MYHTLYCNTLSDYQGIDVFLQECRDLYILWSLDKRNKRIAHLHDVYFGNIVELYWSDEYRAFFGEDGLFKSEKKLFKNTKDSSINNFIKNFLCTQATLFYEKSTDVVTICKCFRDNPNVSIPKDIKHIPKLYGFKVEVGYSDILRLNWDADCLNGTDLGTAITRIPIIIISGTIKDFKNAGWEDIKLINNMSEKIENHKTNSIRGFIAERNRDIKRLGSEIKKAYDSEFMNIIPSIFENIINEIYVDASGICYEIDYDGPQNSKKYIKFYDNGFSPLTSKDQIFAFAMALFCKKEKISVYNLSYQDIDWHKSCEFEYQRRIRIVVNKSISPDKDFEIMLPNYAPSCVPEATEIKSIF